MALVFTNGWDHLTITTDNATLQSEGQLFEETMYYTNASHFNVAAGRFGGGALQVDTESVGAEKWVVYRTTNRRDISTFTLGWNHFCGSGFSTWGGNPNLFVFGTARGWHCCLQVLTSRAIQFCRGENVENLAITPINTFPQDNAWHNFELQVVISDTVGSVKLRMDGVEIMNTSGIGTKNIADAWVDMMKIGSISTVPGTRPDWRFDDIWFTDEAAYLGPMWIETLVPNGDTASKDFTPSSGGINYTMVDDILLADYVEKSGLGADIYALTNLSDNPSLIKGVNVKLLTKKMDAGPRQLRTKIKLSGSTINGDVAPNSSATYKWSNYYLDTNPLTSSPFIGFDLNSLQAGCEVI